MISKTNRYYLDKLKEMAVDNEVHLSTKELAKKLYLSESHLRDVLMILAVNESLEVLKTKGHISGVHLK